MWLDAWSPDRDPADAPADVRGVVCARHGALLSPPRGWTLDDRRESIPRLFKPRDRGALSVVPTEVAPAPKKPKRDPTAPTRRPKAVDLPRPRLFADLDESASVISSTTSPVEPEPVVVLAPETNTVLAPETNTVLAPETNTVHAPETNTVHAPETNTVHAPEPTVAEPRQDDSTELLIRQDNTAPTSRPTTTFDPDEDFARDATGPLLREALRPRLSGRFDPTAELLRPTDVDSEHA